MPDETTNDISLIELITERGERAAGSYLVRTHASDVYGLCRAIVRDRVLAEDLAHDVFARALVALSTYRGEASSRTWILTIARNRCFDHLRAQKRERALLFDEPTAIDQHVTDEPLTIDRMASEQSLRTALESLDEGDRALVVLRHAHAMGFAELAQVFGAREGAIRMRLSRAVTRMKAALDGAEAMALPAGPGCVTGAPPPMPMGAPPMPMGAPPMPMGAPPMPSRGIAPMPPPGMAPPAPMASRMFPFGRRPVAPSPAPVAVVQPSYMGLPRDVVSDVFVQKLEALVAAM